MNNIFKLSNSSFRPDSLSPNTWRIAKKVLLFFLFLSTHPPGCVGTESEAGHVEDAQLWISVDSMHFDLIFLVLENSYVDIALFVCRECWNIAV